MRFDQFCGADMNRAELIGVCYLINVVQKAKKFIALTVQRRLCQVLSATFYETQWCDVDAFSCT
jgi:hypothetical protein